MYIKVKKYENSKVKGRAYTYITDMDIAKDDLVVAEFGKSDSVLKVTEVDVEKPDFECKVIKHLATEDEIAETTKAEESSTSGMNIQVIKEVSPEIVINYDELKSSLMGWLTKYSGIVVTSDNLKDCKAMSKDLSRLSRNIDRYRIDKAKELSQPITDFQDQCKALKALIDDVKKPIDEGTNLYDQKVKNGNIVFAKKEIEEAVAVHELNNFYAGDLTVKSDYSNLSMTHSKIKDDIEQRAQVLEIEQKAYSARRNAVQAVIDEENKTLTHGLEIVDYDIACYEQQDSSTVIEMVRKNASKIRSIEEAAKEEAQRIADEKAGLADVPEDIPACEPVPGQMSIDDVPEETCMPSSMCEPVQEEPLPEQSAQEEPEQVPELMAFADIRISGDLSIVDNALTWLDGIDGLELSISNKGAF